MQLSFANPPIERTPFYNDDEYFSNLHALSLPSPNAIGSMPASELFAYSCIQHKLFNGSKQATACTA